MGRLVHVSTAMGCTVHWGPASPHKYSEVVLGADARVAAGTAVRVAAGKVRAHVVDAIGEERPEPETETAANKESGSTELDEAAPTCSARERGPAVKPEGEEAGEE